MAEDATASALGYHDPKAISSLSESPSDHHEPEEDSEFRTGPWR